MTDITFKEKITKRNFIVKLIDDFGVENLSEVPYHENSMDEYGTPYVKKLTLFYYYGEHAATWHAGEGWIFQSAYDAKKVKDLDVNSPFI